MVSSDSASLYIYKREPGTVSYEKIGGPQRVKSNQNTKSKNTRKRMKHTCGVLTTHYSLVF